MTWLKQSTVVTVQLGAFLDATDGVVPETGLATAMDNATTGIRVSKNGAVMIDRNSATVPAHDDDGHYRIELSTTDTNTLGTLRIQYEESGITTPAWRDFMVVPANVFDSFFGADALQVDVIEQVGTTVPAPTTAGVPDVNVERWLDTLVTLSASLPDVNVETIDANAITAASIAAAALDGKGDWEVSIFTGTSDAGGSTTSMVDAALVEINDEWVGSLIRFTSAGLDRQARLITDFDAASDTITFAPAVTETLAAGFTYEIWQHAPVDIQSWLGLVTALVAPNALISGRVNSSTGAMAANVLTAAAINAEAFTAAKFAAGAIDANALAIDAVNKIRDAILPVSNAALSNIEFLFVAASDHVTPVTAASTITGTRSIDGGSFVSVSGAIAEVGNGIYQFDALAADMNGGIITFRFAATGGTPGAPDDTFVTVVTGAGV